MPSSQLTSALAPEQQKLLACIHCGLCLEACPTYVATGDENDGPRGRLYLMRAVDEGRLASNSETFERHIDRCLGCRACESVCPAGVEYGQLLEASRAELFTSGPGRGFSYKVLGLVLRHVWQHPARLRFFFAVTRLIRDCGIPRVLRKSGIARFVSTRFAFALALLESSAPVAFAKSNEQSGTRKAVVSSTATKRGSALLFKGCVGEGLFARINRATARVLEVNGLDVAAPGNQVCCGALHAHAGDLEGART
ncbi:MAG: (Fe-S)-binding protein, partial [Pyrinomonadaceae bacterium]